MYAVLVVIKILISFRTLFLLVVIEVNLSGLSKMLDYKTSQDGLLQLEGDVLDSVVQKHNILEVYDVDKTPLGRSVDTFIITG